MPRVTFEETTSENVHVELLAGPEPFYVDGKVVGTTSITREDVLSYGKTAADRKPTGDRLVHLVIQPSSGRLMKVRLKYAIGALEALGVISDEEPEPAPAPEPVEAPAPEPVVEEIPAPKAKKS